MIRLENNKIKMPTSTFIHFLKTLASVSKHYIYKLSMCNMCNTCIDVDFLLSLLTLYIYKLSREMLTGVPATG